MPVYSAYVRKGCWPIYQPRLVHFSRYADAPRLQIDDEPPQFVCGAATCDATFEVTYKCIGVRFLREDDYKTVKEILRETEPSLTYTVPVYYTGFV